MKSKSEKKYLGKKVKKGFIDLSEIRDETARIVGEAIMELSGV